MQVEQIMIMNFNPADGDKIKIFDTDGVTPIAQSDFRSAC